MHVLIFAPTSSSAEEMQIALGADRCTLAMSLSDAIACLKDDPPDLIVIERAVLRQIEPAALLELAESARWSPMLFADGPVAESRERIAQAERLTRTAFPVYQVGELCLDTRRKQAGLGERRVTLSPLQYRLLLALVQQTGEVVSYRDLLRAVWGYSGDDNEARELLKFHVRQIRRRLGLDEQEHQYIRSVRGFGYMLAPPDGDRAQAQSN
jgi:two-component system KDP operon response regulator KdpE